MVKCVVLKCPICGKERPYFGDPRAEAPLTSVRLKQGFFMHHVLAHGEEPSAELIEEVFGNARKELEVNDELIKKKKWDYYGLTD